MDIHSFLSKVAEEYSLSFSDLKKEAKKRFVFDNFCFLHTECFERYVKDHEIKRVSENDVKRFYI